MKIDMKIKIEFKFIFNNTGIEQHKLQIDAINHIDKQLLHCMVSNFKGESDLIIHSAQGVKVDMFFRFNLEASLIEIVALKG